MESGSGSKPNTLEFVPFKNASKVFGNGLFRFIGCLRDVSNRLFVPGGGVGWGWRRGEEGGRPKTGMENLSTKLGLKFSTAKRIK